MSRKILLTASVAVLLALAVPLEAALAAPTSTVTVRVEGNSRTLLAPTVTHTHTGSITMGSTPTGKCPATSAAGALDVATRHQWSGKYSTSFNDILINSILGEANPADYWSIWINNRYATTGACEIVLHSGDTVLFAADSIKHAEYPLGLKAPASVKAGRSFTVKVVWFNNAGVAKPLPGASVTGSGAMIGKTNRNGVLTVVANHAGMLHLRAAKNGYIRPAPVTMQVGA